LPEAVSYVIDGESPKFEVEEFVYSNDACQISSYSLVTSDGSLFNEG